MPLALMTDTFQYYRPNVEGILMDLQRTGFSVIIYGLTGQAGNPITNRKHFCLGFPDIVKKGIFTYQHHFVMTHLAHSMNDEHR